jgi:hypothetical protein
MVVDTPILDKDVRDNLRDFRQLGSRLENTKSFREYLDEQWKTFEERQAFFNWPNISFDLLRDIEEVESRNNLRSR